EDGRGDGVGCAGGAEGEGPDADGDHQDGIEERLDDGGAGGVASVGEGGGEADAGGGVVVAVEPADGHEVGELPNEQDGEEGDGWPLDDAADGGPADEWR